MQNSNLKLQQNNKWKKQKHFAICESQMNQVPYRKVIEF